VADFIGFTPLVSAAETYKHKADSEPNRNSYPALLFCVDKHV